jgi:hypothetical protein
LYIIICMYGEQTRRQKILHWMKGKDSALNERKHSLTLISS